MGFLWRAARRRRSHSDKGRHSSKASAARVSLAYAVVFLATGVRRGAAWIFSTTSPFRRSGALVVLRSRAPPLESAAEDVDFHYTLSYDESRDRMNLYVESRLRKRSAAAAAAATSSGGNSAAYAVLPEGEPDFTAAAAAAAVAADDESAANMLSEASTTGKVGIVKLLVLVRFFREEVGIPSDRFRYMVAREPSLLRLSVDNNLRPTLRFFAEEMGISSVHLVRMLQRQPSLLCFRVEGKLRNTVRYFNEELGIRRAGVCTMVIRQPSLFGSSIDEKLRPMAAFLRAAPAADDEDCGGLGFSPRQLRRVVVREPSILTLSLENNVRPKVAAFARELGASPEEVAAAVLASPNLLMCSLEKRVLPRVARMRDGGVLPREVPRAFRLLMYSEAPFERWLARRVRTALFLRELGLSREDLRLMKRRHPPLTTMNIATIAQAVAFLRKDVGLSPEQLRRAIVKYPQVLACSAGDNLAPTAAFFVEDLGLTPAAIRIMLARQPSLLGLSVERNLRPKAAFLRRELGASAKDLATALEANPSLLEYSLERRIRPRVAQMRARGMLVQVASIRQICKLTDAAFERWLAASEWVRHTAHVPAATAAT